MARYSGGRRKKLEGRHNSGKKLHPPSEKTKLANYFKIVGTNRLTERTKLQTKQNKVSTHKEQK
jgi:hypothetical protein